MSSLFREFIRVSNMILDSEIVIDNKVFKPILIKLDDISFYKVVNNWAIFTSKCFWI